MSITPRSRACFAILLAVSGIILYGCRSGHWGDSAILRNDRQLAQVNGVIITQDEIDLLARTGPSQLKAALRTASGKKRVLEELINRELLYAESIRQGLQRDPDLIRQIEMNRRILIANASLAKAITQAAQEYYDTHPEEFTTCELHHILLSFPKTSSRHSGKSGHRSEQKTVALANKIKASFKKGVSFVTLSKQYSDDVASRDHGGFLGQVWKREPALLRRGYQELLEQAFLMEPGTIAGPIRASDGYHLIYIPKAPAKRPFAEVQQTLEFKLRQSTRKQLIDRLRSTAKISYTNSD